MEHNVDFERPLSDEELNTVTGGSAKANLRKSDTNKPLFEIGDCVQYKKGYHSEYKGCPFNVKEIINTGIWVYMIHSRSINTLLRVPEYQLEPYVKTMSDSDLPR